MNRISILLLCVTWMTMPGMAGQLQIRIMSFNIQQPYGTDWPSRESKAAAILQQENADVIGTQEAHSYQRDDLVNSVPAYTWFGSGRDGGDNGEGSWILWNASRYTLDAQNSGNIWLSNTPDQPSRFGGDYNRIATYVHLTENASGQSFYVYNIHNYMPAEASYRMAAAQLLVQKIGERAYGSDPVFVTGDFNSGESDAVTQYMKTQMRDSYRDFDPSGSVTTGFGTKFDYIYYPDQSQYATTNSWVVSSPAGASDHMPIVASITVGESIPPSPLAIPGTVEAESFSAQSDIQVESCEDRAGGADVGWIDDDDWIRYLVDVESTGAYQVEFRVASLEGGGILDLRDEEGTTLGTADIPRTSDWQAWTTVSSMVTLKAGEQTLELHIRKGGFNLNWMRFAETAVTQVANVRRFRALTGVHQVKEARMFTADGRKVGASGMQQGAGICWGRIDGTGALPVIRLAE